jgi:hypothetical protein
MAKGGKTNAQMGAMGRNLAKIANQKKSSLICLAGTRL